MMDKRHSKCRFRVMKFEENAVSSSKYEIGPESVKPAKGPRRPRGPRAPERTRSPDPRASVKDTVTKQDRKSTRTVSKIPVKKIINKRTNIITSELKRIFSSTNYPELNSTREAHQVGDKAKKTKKKAKGKRKKSNLPDYFTRYEDTVTFKCETNKSPRRTRNESLRYEQKRITPSMYYLSAGDSNEREICQVSRDPKATDESCDCDCLPANASHYKDSLSSRNSRKCTEDCTIWRAKEGKNLPICYCSALNMNGNLYSNTNKSGMPVHPASARRPTADIGCNSRARPGSKIVTIKSPSSNTITRSSQKLTNDNFSACKCDRVPSDPSCQCHATCKCRSLNWTFKGRNSLTAVTETRKRGVSVHTDCPALRPILQNTKLSASTMPSFSSNLKAAYHKARTAITGTGDAPRTNPPCVSVQTGGSPASKKLGHSVSCPVDGKTDCHLLIRNPSEMPKYISCDPSYLSCSKIPRTTQCAAPSKLKGKPPCDAVQTEHKIGPDRPHCNISCGSFPVIRSLDGTCSPISVLGNGECISIKPSCLRMRRKPSRRLKIKIGSFFKIKKIFFLQKFGKHVEPDKCFPPKTIHTVAAMTSVPINCVDAETGCLNNSGRAGPSRVYALFQTILTKPTHCNIIHFIAMLVCSPFVAIIYFFRFVTSPIRPSGSYNAAEICPHCLPPNPCKHALIRIFKTRQRLRPPTVRSNAEATTCQTTCTYFSKISGKCSETRSHGNQKIPSKCSKSRSRKDHKISRCSKCPKPPPCEVRFSDPLTGGDKCSKRPPCKDKCYKPPPCADKCSKPPPCADKCPKRRPCKDKCSKESKPPPKNPRTSCLHKRRPCVTAKCLNRKCKLKNVTAGLRCRIRKFYKEALEFWERNQPEEPSPEACVELTGPYDMLPPPPYFMYDSYVWRKRFFRGRPKPRDSWYYYCTYLIAATFWCPLGLCLFFTFKCLGKCYR